MHMHLHVTFVEASLFHKCIYILLCELLDVLADILAGSPFVIYSFHPNCDCMLCK